MSFHLTRTHTSVVLAATTIAASLVVIPTLAEGTQRECVGADRAPDQDGGQKSQGAGVQQYTKR